MLFSKIISQQILNIYLWQHLKKTQFKMRTPHKIVSGIDY